MTLQVDQCTEKQQEEADEFLNKTSTIKDKTESISKGKTGESIGFQVTNNKGKALQGIGSEDIKVIQGISNIKNKAKESYANKDKKTLKKELEDWFDDD
eukprot:CAMPEP_0205799180 /NCGR_PEP_ID=MMETSP0205-20121125/364_1 /ASSEMBLY_ACC=CAM_ASM_000278 /TAXON_ID=36767 /ORGANISM="Euplotes focardii, Strain TN1" /LENGTH=98 /DNA_ID=CAMNT_0053060061 /DNA_START=208 /DNA_END=501 /DNA_ORIENTATION=-